MDRVNIEDRIFEKNDFAATPLLVAEYDNCSFINCNFSNAQLSNTSFSECHFKDCNLSMTHLTRSAFKDVDFNDCKLVGLHFEHCDPFLFSVSFAGCSLQLCSFYKLRLKKTIFNNCLLHEVDFTEADLTAAGFQHCDLQGSVFENTILEGADFRTSQHYVIDPEINRIKKAKFSLDGISGLLHKYDIDINYG